MPYTGKEQAKACWRRRNAKPERKAYMAEYTKQRINNRPECRKAANDACKRWAAKPESQRYNTVRQQERRATGKVKATDLRNKEAIAGRPKPTRCEVCDRLPKGKGLHFDHCHQHGHFRGWLCNGCNCALGLVNDDPDILIKLVEYLKRNQPAWW
jgi:hypothetical protein